MNPNEEYWDASLLLRVERRKSGANTHDVNCLVHRYRGLCEPGLRNLRPDPFRAKWIRDVLMIFANGQASTIEEAERIHYEAFKKTRTNA